MKRIISVLVALALGISTLAGCAPSSGKGGEENTKNVSGQTPDAGKKEGKLFEKPEVLKMMINSHASWPFQQDWYITNAIKEKTNVQLDVIAVPASSWGEKINLTMTSGDLPDMIYADAATSFKYGPQGAFIDIMKHLDKMPGFKKWYDGNKDYVRDYKLADGQLCIFPEQGIAETNRRGYLYREDTFKKLNISPPKDENELMDVLKKLKAEYPKSFPFSFQGNFFSQLALVAQSWGASTGYKYDSAGKKVAYGPVEDKFKEVVAYFNKLYQEKLIAPDFLSMTAKGWQDLLSTDGSFITLAYLGRIDFFNSALRKDNPQYTLSYMPPFKGGKDGVSKLGYSASNTAGMLVSSNSKKLNEVLKYMDWMYSDEARELVSWGEEGKTFKMENGKRRFIDAEDLSAVRKNYGLSTYGFYLRLDYDSHISTFSEELTKAVVESRKYDLDPVPTVVLTEAETESTQVIADNILKYMQEQVSKFIIGSRPLSEWDKYVKELEGMGLGKLLEVQNKAYERYLKN